MDRQVPLGLLFLAVQFSDILGALLVFFGIERVIIIPGISEVNPMDLAYYPYSHSLAGTLLWSIAAYTLISVLPLKKTINKKRFALVISGGIISHFILDYLVHPKDLPLLATNSLLVGLGLTNHMVISYLLETSMFLAGLSLYLGMISPRKRLGKQGIVIFGVFLIIINKNIFLYILN